PGCRLLHFGSVLGVKNGQFHSRAPQVGQWRSENRSARHSLYEMISTTVLNQSSAMPSTVAGRANEEVARLIEQMLRQRLLVEPSLALSALNDHRREAAAAGTGAEKLHGVGGGNPSHGAYSEPAPSPAAGSKEWAPFLSPRGSGE